MVLCNSIIQLIDVIKNKCLTEQKRWFIDFNEQKREYRMFKILDILIAILILTGNIFPIITNLTVAEGANVWLLLFNGFVVVVVSILLYQKLKNYRNSRINHRQ